MRTMIDKYRWDSKSYIFFTNKLPRSVLFSEALIFKIARTRYAMLKTNFEPFGVLYFAETLKNPFAT